LFTEVSSVVPADLSHEVNDRLLDFVGGPVVADDQSRRHGLIRCNGPRRDGVRGAAAGWHGRRRCAGFPQFFRQRLVGQDLGFVRPSSHSPEDRGGVGISQWIHARGHARGFHLNAPDNLANRLDREVDDVVVGDIGTLEVSSCRFDHDSQIGWVVAVFEDDAKDFLGGD
jgi:hypothetical protein